MDKTNGNETKDNHADFSKPFLNFADFSKANFNNVDFGKFDKNKMEE